MLTIHYGDMDGVVYNTSVFFNNTYSPKWFEDPFAQKVIKVIDRGVMLGPNAIETKILGVIPPEKLSSGTKNAFAHVLHAGAGVQRLELRGQLRTMDSGNRQNTGHHDQPVPPYGFRQPPLYRPHRKHRRNRAYDERARLGGWQVPAGGDAFGPEMELLTSLQRFKAIQLYLPESFEWLVLQSGLLPDKQTRDMLENLAAYVESERFFSWEQFFAHELIEKTRGNASRLQQIEAQQRLS